MEKSSLGLEGGRAKRPQTKPKASPMTNAQIHAASLISQKAQRVIQPDLLVVGTPIENLPNHLKTPEDFCLYTCKAGSGKIIRNIAEGTMNDLLIHHGPKQLPEWMQYILGGNRQGIANRDGVGMEIFVENLKNGTQRFTAKWVPNGTYCFDLGKKQIIKQG